LVDLFEVYLKGLKQLRWKGADWINLAEDLYNLCDVVNTVMDLLSKLHYSKCLATEQLVAYQEGIFSI
jgi:hypothetical protein